MLILVDADVGELTTVRHRRPNKTTTKTTNFDRPQNSLYQHLARHAGATGKRRYASRVVRVRFASSNGTGGLLLRVRRSLAVRTMYTQLTGMNSAKSECTTATNDFDFRRASVCG